MRILYIDHYAGSLRDGMEFRPYYLAREWVKMGHTVQIIGADYSHLRTNQPQVTHDFSTEKIDSISYQWIKAGSYDGNGVNRALTMFRFVTKLVCNARKIANDFEPDVVITSSTYPLDSFAGYKISRKAKAMYIHEAHDVWPLTLIELGGISKYNPFVILLAISERYAYKHANKVVSVLPNTLDHMMECGLGSKEKFVYIPNGIAQEDWERPEPLPKEHDQILQRLKNDRQFIICYLGGHGLSNALDVLLDAAKAIKSDAKVSFVLIGKGEEKNRLTKRSIDENISNVIFLPPLVKKQIPTALSQVDALYIGAMSCPLYRFGVSMNKVYDYMMSGIPMLYGVKASNNEVEEAQCGITIEPGSKDAIVDAIDEVRRLSKAERAQMGINGKTWVLAHCEYKLLAKKFVSIMKG